MNMASKMILYYTLRSPPCRSVLLTAAELGLKMNLQQVNVKLKENVTSEFLKMNPLHTIPVLNDKGTLITDSHVICSYLVDKYAGNDTLYPQEPNKRRGVDTQLYYDCGHVFPRLRMIVEPIIHMGGNEIPAERIEYMKKSYEGLENALANAPYLCGEQMTIADLCSIATVSSAMKFAAIDAEKFPKLREWVERMSKLPYYQEQNQEGADQLYNLVQDLLKERNAKK